MEKRLNGNDVVRRGARTAAERGIRGQLAKKGKVAVRQFQIQNGPKQWIGVAAFGTIGIYVVIAAALDTESNADRR